MKNKFSVGQKIRYTFYGVEETAIITKVGSGVLLLDNGRWMHAISCEPITT